MTSGPVIDADAHAAEDVTDLARNFRHADRSLAPAIDGLPGLEGHLCLDGRRLTARFSPPGGSDRLGPAALDPLERVRLLDAEGIDMSVIFPTLGLLAPVYRDPDAAAAFCAAVNDWVLRFCAVAPTRLAPVAVLPQHDPALSVIELDRAVAAGAVAAVVRPNPVGGLTVADAAFDVLWDAAESLDVAVILHEGAFDVGIETLGSDRAVTYGELHLMSHPFEVQATLATLVMRGALDRYRRLRLGVFEAGFGWAPYLEHRIEEHRAVYGGGAVGSGFGGRVWVTGETEEPALMLAGPLGWSGHVCYASDFPHADHQSTGSVRRARRALGAAAEAFLGLNALDLFGERLAARVPRT